MTRSWCRKVSAPSYYLVSIFFYFSVMIWIVFGLLGLWLGTKWIVQGSLGVAKLYKLSHTFVGIAILAIGTDLPEVFVTIDASILHLKGIESSGIITGNAIGSGIAQITIILGTAGLLLKFTIEKKDLFRDGVALYGSVFLLFLFGFDGIVSRWEGAIFLLVYSTYFIVLLKNRKVNDADSDPNQGTSLLILVSYLTIGFITLIFSSYLVVENAIALSIQWGVDQSFVGIAILGLGTSLPELAVSIGAALKRAPELSVGNIIGSNIFDGFIPIGLGGLISTTYLETNLLKFDLPVLLIATTLVLIFLNSKRGISKVEGIILILIYLSYMFIKVFSSTN